MTMSDALIGCQPRIDEPSNARPSSKRPSSRRVAGMVVCCHTPGKSMNLRSTNLTSCFFARSSTSFGVILSAPSDGFFPTFARSNPHGLFHRDDEDLPVADAPGLRALLDGVQHVVHQVVRDDDLDL